MRNHNLCFAKQKVTWATEQFSSSVCSAVLFFSTSYTGLQSTRDSPFNWSATTDGIGISLIFFSFVGSTDTVSAKTLHSSLVVAISSDTSACALKSNLSELSLMYSASSCSSDSSACALKSTFPELSFSSFASAPSSDSSACALRSSASWTTTSTNEDSRVTFSASILSASKDSEQKSKTIIRFSEVVFISESRVANDATGISKAASSSNFSGLSIRSSASCTATSTSEDSRKSFSASMLRLSISAMDSSKYSDLASRSSSRCSRTSSGIAKLTESMLSDGIGIEPATYWPASLDTTTDKTSSSCSADGILASLASSTDKASTVPISSSDESSDPAKK
ncbi:hypothetical protein Lal_00019952 [Lupinus albus]|nr:hypothetical protein Lal_00019952 [Lupinus albus]